MDKETKKNFVKKYLHTDCQIDNWEEIVDQYGIKYADVFNCNSKYTITKENKPKEKHIYCISNGDASDCVPRLNGVCTIDCYAKKGHYHSNSTKLNKLFQRVILQKAPLEWLIGAIKYFNAKQPRLRLQALRINETNDLTQELLDKTVELCKLLQIEQLDVVVFAYTKMYDLDFSEASKLPNLAINTSESLKPVYSGSNCFIAVSEDEWNSIQETDTIKRCNCEMGCYEECGYCLKDNGYILYEKLI